MLAHDELGAGESCPSTAFCSEHPNKPYWYDDFDSHVTEHH